MGHTENVAALRARLEARRETLIKALHGFICKGKPSRDDVLDRAFRRLGIVTFWQSLPDPTEEELAYVNRLLDDDTMERSL